MPWARVTASVVSGPRTARRGPAVMQGSRVRTVRSPARHQSGHHGRRQGRVGCGRFAYPPVRVGEQPGDDRWRECRVAGGYGSRPFVRQTGEQRRGARPAMSGNLPEHLPHRRFAPEDHVLQQRRGRVRVGRCLGQDTAAVSVDHGTQLRFAEAWVGSQGPDLGGGAGGDTREERSADPRGPGQVGEHVEGYTGTVCASLRRTSGSWSPASTRIRASSIAGFSARSARTPGTGSEASRAQACRGRSWRAASAQRNSIDGWSTKSTTASTSVAGLRSAACHISWTVDSWEPSQEAPGGRSQSSRRQCGS